MSSYIKCPKTFLKIEVVLIGCLDGWIDGCMNEQTVGSIDGCTDEQMDG